MQGTKLIILRGPSGAGKSTVAKELQKRSSRNVALVEQDYFREVMFLHRHEGGEIRRELLATNALIALRGGFDVIIEGILTPDRYHDFFARLFSEHPDENYMFYFDISFDETARRHATREKAKQFSANEMAEWYDFAKPSQFDFEEIIPEHSTVEQTIATIRKLTGV